MKQNNNSYFDLSSEKPKEPVFTVSQLNNQIKQLLNDSFKGGIWICGEIYRYELDIVKSLARAYRQVYFELIEQLPETKEIKATISAVIWGDDRDRIEEKLRKIGTGIFLKDGLNIKVRCYVDFYPPQGKVQLRIVDIDPEYTIGKMALDKKLLLEKLKKTGLLEKNKQLLIPPVPLNIGLITSIGTAAYNDFIHELKISGYGFEVYLCDARMQGSELEVDVVRSIAILNRYDVDVIAIVRGGGSASDLMWFDKEGVAVAIANSRKPVLTGIGHQIDRTVSDEVANQSFKTPTAVAQFLVEKVSEFETEIENVFKRIKDEAENRIVREFDALENISRRIKSSILLFTQQLHNKVLQFKEKLLWNIKKFFENGFRRLEEFERFNNSKNPLNIVKMGFGIIYSQEKKVVKSVEQVKIGEKITAEIKDGRLFSTVNSKEKKNG